VKKAILVVVAFALILSSLMIPVFAKTISDVQKEKNTVDSKLNSITKQRKRKSKNSVILRVKRKNRVTAGGKDQGI